jgi:hypothetical protein
MHRSPPYNPTAIRPLLLNQNLVDEPIDSIEARVVHEKDPEWTATGGSLGSMGAFPVQWASPRLIIRQAA